jgi:hypothetical protein
MNILTKPSLLLFVALAAISSIGYSDQPPDVVASDGNANTAMGTSALFNLTDGFANTASGYAALFANTTGYDNAATGYAALNSNTTGTANTATGSLALVSNTTGDSNSAFGYGALNTSSIGSFNSAFGYGAMSGNMTGSYNTAQGSSAAFNNLTGRRNVAVGFRALQENTAGHGNTAIGTYAGQHTTGNDNVLVANRGMAGESQTMRLGVKGTAGVVGSGVIRTYIAGIKGVTTGLAGSQVLIDANGQLGTISSSRRYKEDIQNMADASDRLLELRPVTFRYKQADATGEHPMQYGLIAEEVAEVFPELVIPNEAGQPETVAYQLLPSLLLNEVQKEHRLIQQQAEQLAAQASQLAEVSELKRQLAEVQELLAHLQSQTKEEQVAMK